MYNLFYVGYNLDYGKYYEDMMLDTSKDPEFTEIDAEYNGFGGNINVDKDELLQSHIEYYEEFIEENGFDINQFMKYINATHTLYYITDGIFYIEEYRLALVNHKFIFHLLSSRSIPVHAFPDRYVYFYEIYQEGYRHCHYGYSFTYDNAYQKIKNFKDKRYARLYRASLYHKELPTIQFSKERANELYYDVEKDIPDNPKSYYEYLMDISDGEMYEYNKDMKLCGKWLNLVTMCKFTREELLDYDFYCQAKSYHTESGRLLPFMRYLILMDYQVTF